MYHLATLILVYIFVAFSFIANQSLKIGGTGSFLFYTSFLLYTSFLFYTSFFIPAFNFISAFYFIPFFYFIPIFYFIPAFYFIPGAEHPVHRGQLLAALSPNAVPFHNQRYWLLMPISGK
jgi:hypothetical protein